jgi:hypothetical protein
MTKSQQMQALDVIRREIEERKQQIMNGQRSGEIDDAAFNLLATELKALDIDLVANTLAIQTLARNDT